MEFDLSGWHGVNAALFIREGRFTSEAALDVLHLLATDHVGRELLRSMNGDDDERIPHWTMAESAAWDMRSKYGHPQLAAVVSSVPGRDLCINLAHSDVGFYLSMYALTDLNPLIEAVSLVHSRSGQALAWGLMTSAWKYIEHLARDERVREFVATVVDENEDGWWNLPEDGLGLQSMVDSGFAGSLAADADPKLLNLCDLAAARDLREALAWLPGGDGLVAAVGDALVKRATSPKNSTDEIYADTIAKLEPATAASSLVLGAVLSQLSAIPAAIAMVAAIETDLTSGDHREAATTGTIFGLLESLISELESAFFENRQRSFDLLVRIAAERDVALDAVAWATSEIERVKAVIDELRAERDLLGEQLLAEQRRRLRETGELASEVDALVRQQGLDNAVIRELNAYIDSRQRRRLRETMRDIVAGAGLGGTLYGEAGAIAGGILGLLGAIADDASE